MRDSPRPLLYPSSPLPLLLSQSSYCCPLGMVAQSKDLACSSCSFLRGPQSVTAPFVVSYVAASLEHLDGTGDYYGELFGGEPSYSTPYPNPDEASRWAKLCGFLSRIPNPEKHGAGQSLRILDVGCGRGWLTYSAHVWGQCDGVDPSPGAIEQARKYFPHLRFYTGTAANVVDSLGFRPYDVALVSEVIEHVADKDSFVIELKRCLRPQGHVLLTTPRGILLRKYLRGYGSARQPVEAWISEGKLRGLFEHHGFTSVAHDRAYIPLPRMGRMHSLYATTHAHRQVARRLDDLRLGWVQRALDYSLAIYQVWWFQLKGCS
jgi:SAM-dependent methyltransferase